LPRLNLQIANATPTLTNIILVITATTTALMSGLFYAFSCSVNLGLARLSNVEYISAMQSTNRAIQNPIFFAAFFAAPILLPLSVLLHYGQPLTMRFWFLLAATIIYLIGTSRKAIVEVGSNIAAIKSHHCENRYRR
jgi:uncharacterized membrane protein